MIGKKIAELRKTEQISQEELANMLSTSRQAVSKWEREESFPDIDRLKELAICFNVSMDYLMDYDVESYSVNTFIEKLTKCKAEENLSITVNEIKSVVSKNRNNFNLLIHAAEYLSCLYAKNYQEEVLDLIMDFCKKALLVYQDKNALNLTINGLHKTIANCYIFKKQYVRAKEYIEENNVYNSEDMLAEIDFELGNYDHARNILSENLLQGISLIINTNYTKVKLHLINNELNDAIDLCNWCINFIKSIGKDDDLFLDVDFELIFLRAACELLLNIDTKESMEFLRNNGGRLRGIKSDTDKIKFYQSKKVTFISPTNNIKEEIYSEIVKFKKNPEVYKALMAIYNDLFE